MFYRLISLKLRQARDKIIVALFCLVIFSVFRPKHNKSVSLKLDYVVVHLDLKGAPPKLSYLESLLPMLKNNGVNGLLIEYEDMFPYEGSLKVLASHYCYKKEELQKFLAVAVSSGFEIIPLVQTFGHLEFVLSTKKFAHLRESLSFYDTICPSFLESKRLLREMLTQVILFHQRITPLKYIHVGCDEAHHIKECDICRQRNLTKAELITSHINFLLNTVHNLNPDTSVLIWDDMFREVKPLQLINLKFPKTETVYWDYTRNIHEVSYINMHKYNKMFDNIWVATAFKGADGKSSILPDLKTRFLNHHSWLDFILNSGMKGNLYKFKGIILTGWSRYKHGDPLCELLPVSIPSLVLNLILIQLYRNGVIVNETLHMNDFIDQHIKSKLASKLQCHDNLDYFLDNFAAKSCEYNESNVYVLLQSLNKLTLLFNSITEENFLNYFIKPDIEGHLDEKYYSEKFKTCSKIYNELSHIEDKIVDVLPNYFDDHIVGEFLQVKVLNVSSKIMELLKLWKTFKKVNFDVYP